MSFADTACTLCARQGTLRSPPLTRTRSQAFTAARRAAPTEAGTKKREKREAELEQILKCTGSPESAVAGRNYPLLSCCKMP